MEDETLAAERVEAASEQYYEDDEDEDFDEEDEDDGALLGYRLGGGV